MASPLDPIPPSHWNVSTARHLLNRAGFGVPFEETRRLALLEPAEAVAHFVDYERLDPRFVPPRAIEVDPDQEAERLAFQQTARRLMNGMDGEGADFQMLRAESRRRQMEFRRQQRIQVERLQAWWLRRMLESPRPLEEKMVLFWHGHFATSAEKVRSPQANYDLNALFRSAATANFKLLTYEVGCSPAMMLYLDNAASRKEHPNENWARELMELYTLGQGRYTEEDIKAAARAFTGWTTDGESFSFRPAVHDDGVKVFMGHRGNLNGQDIFDIIFARPETAEFIAVKLWEFFAYADPEPEIRRGLARTLYAAGYDLKPLLRQIFLARAFYGDRALATRIKSPVELLAGMVDVFRPDPDPLLDDYLVFLAARMGQNLFHPPNVKGWPGGKAWISAGTLMSRYNASAFFSQGMLTDLGPALRQRFVQRHREDPRFRRALREARLERSTASGDRQDPAPVQDAAAPGDIGMMEGMMPGPMLGEGAAVPAPPVIRLPSPPADVRAVFEAYDGSKLGEVVSALSNRLFALPISSKQQQVFARTLGPGKPAEAIFTAADWPEPRLRATLHLMLSTAEFQLC